MQTGGRKTWYNSGKYQRMWGDLAGVGSPADGQSNKGNVVFCLNERKIRNLASLQYSL